MSHQWIEPRLDRAGKQFHVRLLRRASAFATVATQTATHDVFPSRSATVRPGHDVIEAEFVRRFRFAAILASVIIASEQVLSIESNRLGRHAIEPGQSSDPRDLHFKPDGLNVFILWLLLV